MLSRPWSVCLLLMTGAVLPSPLWAAHRHDELTLELVQESMELSIELRVPGETLLGFERAPRNREEEVALGAMLKELRQPGSWLVPDARAQCSLGAVTVKTSGFEADSHEQEHQHAEIRASYRFHCKAPAQLRMIEVRLFKRYPQLKRIQADMVLSDRQDSQTLSARSTKLMLQP